MREEERSLGVSENESRPIGTHLQRVVVVDDKALIEPIGEVTPSGHGQGVRALVVEGVWDVEPYNTHSTQATLTALTARRSHIVVVASQSTARKGYHG